jgi:hypothetical protein
MLLRTLTLTAYGRCTDVTIEFGDGVTVVVGTNEAGKSTALDALSDLLWGIPLKTPRASEYQRAQLRIDATLDIEHEPCALVRKSTGLYADDLVTPVNPPWFREGLDALWWRTRLGINHDDLRRGGQEVFAGAGDIAELVYAAREGRSARAVLAEIDARADELFKPHKGNKSVKLRVAEAAYVAAVKERDDRLTRAGDVVEQRTAVAALERDLERARTRVSTTSEALKRAAEDARVITNVLSLRQARVDLHALDSEGDRLSPEGLDDYLEAVAAHAAADKQAVQLTGEIANLNRLISDLAVDDALLDDTATLTRLQPLAKARIEELKRADEEIEPAVREANARLRTLLQQIGVEPGEDLETSLAIVRVRTDHAATLDDLADRIEALETKRETAKEKRNEALDALLAKGVAVDLAVSKPPSEDAIDSLREALQSARNAVDTQSQILLEARRDTANLRDGAPGTRAEATITHSDVLGHRRQRDAQWSEVRRSWVSGELPDPGMRVDMAADLDARIQTADRAADDESSERAHLAAQDARIGAHVEGLEAARLKEEVAEAALDEARAEAARQESGWKSTWSALGIEQEPTPETSATVVDLLVTAHAAHARDLSAAGQLSNVATAWEQAAALVGLVSASTPAAWRAQAAVLEQVAAVQAGREEAQVREGKARAAWESFRTEALELLHRHGLADDGQGITPAQVELGLTQLTQRHVDAAAASASRSGYREQIDAKTLNLEVARLTAEQASGVRQRLAAHHDVQVGEALDQLAERAERAADPLARQATAVDLLAAGVDPGSTVADVISRLDGHSEVTVGLALAAAQESDDEARTTENAIRDRRTTALIALDSLETAAGAADAEAEVIARQSEVARLTEEWAVLALQRRLLEKVLVGLGGDSARPLLTLAGEILDRLTDGRWVALRAEEDATSRRLKVLRADNEPTGTAELSEGTADQVFFALRLAAVAELHAERVAAGEQALPLVLDDVLMSFDDDRTADALEILRDLAPGLQVIVFTHHQRVADAAAGLAGIVVAALPAPAPIAGALAGEQVRTHAQQGGVGLVARQAQVPRAAQEVDAAAVRKWAQEQGLDVGARGRVAPAIVEQYLRAQQ